MPSPRHLCRASLDSVTAPQFIPRPNAQRALRKYGRRDPPSPDHHPMAAQFIDLAREITHSPFPNQLRSITWPSGSPLVGVRHVPDQSHTTGKAQQTGGWNSGAVALPDEIDTRVATQIYSDTREREFSDHRHKSDKNYLNGRIIG